MATSTAGEETTWALKKLKGRRKRQVTNLVTATSPVNPADQDTTSVSMYLQNQSSFLPLELNKRDPGFYNIQSTGTSATAQPIYHRLMQLLLPPFTQDKSIGQ